MVATAQPKTPFDPADAARLVAEAFGPGPVLLIGGSSSHGRSHAWNSPMPRCAVPSSSGCVGTRWDFGPTGHRC